MGKLDEAIEVLRRVRNRMIGMVVRAGINEALALLREVQVVQTLAIEGIEHLIGCDAARNSKALKADLTNIARQLREVQAELEANDEQAG